METRSAKRRKLMHSSLRKEAEARAAEIDHISNLPDDVIHRILGLLPLKTIAITSVLSRRWAQIWHSFPDLDFTTVSPTRDHRIRLPRTKLSKRFRGVMEGGTRKLLFLHDHDHDQQSSSSSSKDLITKVLSFRHKNSDLRTLRLHAYVSLTCLNNLIRRALRFNVCELDVEFATDGAFNMPKRVISNGSLRILRFRSKSPFPGFRPPPLGAGSRFLQELALSRVILDKQPLLTDIFTDTSFPALKKLSLTDCSRLKRINIRCSGLQEVTLQHCHHLEVLEVDAARLDKLRVSNCFYINNVEQSFVKLDAPRLRVVEWEQNGVTRKTLFLNLTAMESASVGYRKIPVHTAIPLSISTLVSTSSFLLGLSHVRRLKLWNQCITILEDRNFGNLTPFNNLGFLDVSVSFSKSTTRALSLLFRSCPSLHTFILSISSYDYDDRKQWNKDLWKATSLEKEQYWETQMHAMKPFLGHLKVVKIGGFIENEDQVSMVKFLLKYGQALEEMAVKYYSNSHVSLAQAKSHLTDCTRAASNAKIYIL